MVYFICGKKIKGNSFVLQNYIKLTIVKGETGLYPFNRVTGGFIML